MPMPERNGHAVQGGWANGSTTIIGNTNPTDLIITDRYNATPIAYTATNSITFVGEYIDNGNDDYVAYIDDGNTTSGSYSSDASNGGYRYGFNGKEKSNEIYGEGNSYDYGFRIYDGRLGRWLSIDPLAAMYKGISPYCYTLNNPIKFIDPDGRWVKGAGFWRNITMSDAHIRAEDGARGKLDAKIQRVKGGDYTVSYTQLTKSGDLNFRTDRYNGKTANPNTSITIPLMSNLFEQASNDNIIKFGEYFNNLKTAIEMTEDWKNGTGSDYRIFFNTAETKAMRNAWRVNEARDYFYSNKNPSIPGSSVTDYNGKFGIEGLTKAGIDPIEQFIGSYSLNIHSNGTTILFMLYNTTSVESLMYGVGPEYERSTLKQGGNMRQLYLWTELVKK